MDLITLSTTCLVPLEMEVALPQSITLHFFSAFLCAAIAAAKGRSALVWFIAGLLASCCLALPVLLILPDVNTKERNGSPPVVETTSTDSPPPPPPSPEPAPLPPVETPEWFYEEAREAAGPVSLASLVALIRGGTVSADTLVWREGMEDWSEAREIAELEDHV